MSDRALVVSAWEALFRAQVGVMRQLGTEFPCHDISFNEYDVLYTLARARGQRLRLRDLNRNVLLTQPSVSRLIDRIVARGLVEKLPDASDARGTIIHLTDAGREVFRAVGRVHAESIDRLVGTALDENELHQLIELTSKLRAALPD